jgi:hypothetical protein
VRTLGAASLCLFVPFSALGCSVSGSGNVVEEEHELEFYDSIALGDGFVGRVIQGQEYGLVVSADDNLMDEVVVKVVAGELFVDLDGLNTRKATLEATFTVPRVTSLDVSDGSILDSHGVNLSADFQMDLSGGSIGRVTQPEGDSIGSLVISSDGGSVFDVKAQAETTLIDISGGGTGTLDGHTKNMTTDLSGGSTLDAWDFPTERLDFDLSGGSVQNAFVEEQGRGELSGGSVLEVRGGGSISANKSGGSTVVHD